MVKQSKRTFVDVLDFITSVGFLKGGNSREQARLTGKGPVAVITDLCIFRPHPVTRELQVTRIHPGVSRAGISTATGWQVQFADDCTETEPPEPEELGVLRELKARTAAAHGAQADAV